MILINLKSFILVETDEQGCAAVQLKKIYEKNYWNITKENDYLYHIKVFYFGQLRM